MGINPKTKSFQIVIKKLPNRLEFKLLARILPTKTVFNIKLVHKSIELARSLPYNARQVLTSQNPLIHQLEGPEQTKPIEIHRKWREFAKQLAITRGAKNKNN